MFFWYLVVWPTGATVRTHRDAARVAPARSLSVLLRDRAAVPVPIIALNGPGDRNAGTDNPGKGTGGCTIGTSVPQRTVPITNV